MKLVEFIVKPVLNARRLDVNVILDNPITGINFDLGPGTEAYFGCTTVFKGETIVFGGKKEPQQVSFYNNHSIFRIWIPFLI